MLSLHWPQHVFQKKGYTNTETPTHPPTYTHTYIGGVPLPVTAGNCHYFRERPFRTASSSTVTGNRIYRYTLRHTHFQSLTSCPHDSGSSAPLPCLSSAPGAKRRPVRTNGGPKWARATSGAKGRTTGAMESLGGLDVKMG